MILLLDIMGVDGITMKSMMRGWKCVVGWLGRIYHLMPLQHVQQAGMECSCMYECWSTYRHVCTVCWHVFSIVYRTSPTCTPVCSTISMVGSEECSPTLPYSACLSWVWAYLTWTIVWQCWQTCAVYISCVGTAARALAPSGETLGRRHVESGVISPCISSS